MIGMNAYPHPVPDQPRGQRVHLARHPDDPPTLDRDLFLLLELGHGAHLAVEDDETAGLNVDAGGEQPRCGDQHGVSGFRVDEVAELRLPFGIAAGDAHDVAVVTVHEVGVLVDEGLAHAGGVLPIHVENDGLLKGIAGFGQEPGDLAGDNLGPFVEHEVEVESLVL